MQPTRQIISFLAGWGMLMAMADSAIATTTAPLIGVLDNTTWLVRSKAVQTSAGNDVTRIGDVVNWTITQTTATSVNIRVTRNGEFIRDRAAYYSHGLLIAGTHSESNDVRRGVSIIGTVSGSPGKLRFKGHEVAVSAQGGVLIGKTAQLSGKQSAVVAPDAGKSRARPLPASALTVDDIVGVWQFTGKGIGLSAAGSEKGVLLDRLRITRVDETEVEVVRDADPLGGPLVGHFRDGLLLVRGGSLSDELCLELLLLNLSLSGQPGKLKMKGAAQVHRIVGPMEVEAVVLKVAGTWIGGQ